MLKLWQLAREPGESQRNCGNLPENLGNLKGLEELYLRGTTIKELPLSIEGLTALTFLTLNYCKNHVCLPSTICSLKLLEFLDLSGCSNCDNLPKNLGNFRGFKMLFFLVEQLLKSCHHQLKV